MRLLALSAAIVSAQFAPGLAAEAGDGAIAVCEAITVSQLLSPASYKLVRATVAGGAVGITYDAANAFGALLRGKSECQFVLTETGFRLRDEPDLLFEASLPDCMKTYDAEVAAGTMTAAARDHEVAVFCTKIPGSEEAFLAVLSGAGVPYPVSADATSLAR